MPGMKNFGILIVLLVVGEETRCGVPNGSYGRNRYERPVIPCSSSSECPDNSCCMNADGQLVNGEGQELWGGLGPGLENGTCSRAVSGPGAVCTQRCGCQVVFKVTWARVPTLISYVRSRYEPPVIPCSSSSECPGTTCCRNADGHLVNGEGQEWLGGLDPGLKNGTCSRALSGPGAACTERCGCQKGYTCYRTISGLCCPPTTCWEAEAARIDREYWDNCSKDPNCHLPPSVNPGGPAIDG
ncbi:uncharacterized protein LOC128210432 [Mya arenaria]|uniref:uncharacterized protein LOC128210432 n=1 Tax=Mya arenaria TaxID=6604 RepID=UPI0022E635A5|nr:uncharacterized protein LOC128210432 [Mya arenaria]